MMEFLDEKKSPFWFVCLGVGWSRRRRSSFYLPSHHLFHQKERNCSKLTGKILASPGRVIYRMEGWWALHSSGNWKHVTVCLWRVSQLFRKQPGPNGCSIQHLWVRLRAHLPEGGRESHPELTLVGLWQNVWGRAGVDPPLAQTRQHAPSFLYKPGKVQPWELSGSPRFAH